MKTDPIADLRNAMRWFDKDDLGSLTLERRLYHMSIMVRYLAAAFLEVHGIEEE